LSRSSFEEGAHFDACQTTLNLPGNPAFLDNSQSFDKDTTPNNVSNKLHSLHYNIAQIACTN
jgi:hypothetical protein